MERVSVTVVVVVVMAAAAAAAVVGSLSSDINRIFVAINIYTARKCEDNHISAALALVLELELE